MKNLVSRIKKPTRFARSVIGQVSLIFAVGFLLSPFCLAYNPNVVAVPNSKPAVLEGVGIEEKLGETLDLSIPFINDKGDEITLGSLFKSPKPVLFTIVYYNCPSLCNLHLNGVVETLKELQWTIGQEFELVALSMDSRENFSIAGPKKANYVNAYGRLQSINGWHFLTGTEENIRKIADGVGFSFKWDEKSQQFSHASAAILLTPGGKISRYIHGIQPDIKTLRLGLIEASDGKVGSVLDQILMFCFHFDPKKSKYTLAAWNIMQVGAVLTILIAAILLIPFWVREYNRHGSA